MGTNQRCRQASGKALQEDHKENFWMFFLFHSFFHQMAIYFFCPLREKKMQRRGGRNGTSHQFVLYLFIVFLPFTSTSSPLHTFSLPEIEADEPRII